MVIQELWETLAVGQIHFGDQNYLILYREGGNFPFRNKVKEGSIRFPLFFFEKHLSQVDLCVKIKVSRVGVTPPFSLPVNLSAPPEGVGGCECTYTTREKCVLTFIYDNNLGIPFEAWVCGLGKRVCWTGMIVC